MLSCVKAHLFSVLVFDGRPRKKRNLGAGTGGISGEAPQYGKVLSAMLVARFVAYHELSRDRMP